MQIWKHGDHLCDRKEKGFEHELRIAKHDVFQRSREGREWPEPKWAPNDELFQLCEQVSEFDRPLICKYKGGDAGPVNRYCGKHLLGDLVQSKPRTLVVFSLTLKTVPSSNFI